MGPFRTNASRHCGGRGVARCGQHRLRKFRMTNPNKSEVAAHSLFYRKMTLIPQLQRGSWRTSLLPRYPLTHTSRRTYLLLIVSRLSLGYNGYIHAPPRRPLDRATSERAPDRRNGRIFVSFPFRYSHWANAWTRGRLSCVYGVPVVLTGTLVVWGTLDAMKHRWYLLYPCVHFPLLLYQKEGEKKAPSFPSCFSFLLGAECRGQCWCKLIGIRIDVAGPRTRVTCASSGS